MSVSPASSSHLGSLAIPLEADGSVPRTLHFGPSVVGNLSIKALSEPLSPGRRRSQPLKFEIRKKRGQAAAPAQSRVEVSIKDLLQMGPAPRAQPPKSPAAPRVSSAYVPR